MAILNLRNFPDSIHKKLRVMAAMHGRSMEAEAKAIIIEACGEVKNQNSIEQIPDLIAELYDGTPPNNGVEELIAERRKESKREP